MKRVVIKDGSHVLNEAGEVSKERMLALVELVAQVQKSGKDVIVVSSGAVSSGYSKLKLDKSLIRNKQALAAIGQPLLLKMYQDKFERFDMLCPLAK